MCRVLGEPHWGAALPVGMRSLWRMKCLSSLGSAAPQCGIPIRYAIPMADEALVESWGSRTGVRRSQLVCDSYGGWSACRVLGGAALGCGGPSWYAIPVTDEVPVESLGEPHWGAAVPVGMRSLWRMKYLSSLWGSRTGVRRSQLVCDSYGGWSACRVLGGAALGCGAPSRYAIPVADEVSAEGFMPARNRFPIARTQKFDSTDDWRSMMLRVAVIGMGPIGNRHAKLHKEDPLAELRGCCGREPRCACLLRCTGDAGRAVARCLQYRYRRC